MTSGRALEPSATSWRRAAARCVVLWLGVGLAVSLLGLLGPALLPSNDGPGVPGWPPPPPPDSTLDAVGSSLERWDGLWYLRIAEDGYRPADGSAAFFPLYPLLVRGLSWGLGGHPLAAALLLSHAAFLAALLLLHQAVAEDFGDDTAERTVVFLALFPTSFFFYAPYPESLFLLTSVASLWSARRGRWAAAGAAAALASATRAAGLVLLLPLAAEALRAARARPQGRVRAAALAPLGALAVAPLGAALYALYWHLEFGDWLAPLTQQSRWLREPSWPWQTLVEATTAAWRSLGSFPGGYHMIDWLIVVPMLAVAIWSTPRLPVPQRLYVWGALLPPLCFAFSGRPLMSLPRFLLAPWPLFIGLALLVSRPGPRSALTAVLGAGLALLTVLYATWYWIF